MNTPQTNPDGATTLTDVLAEFDGLGFDGDFRAQDGGEVICSRCGHLFAPTRSDVAGERRLEGASDPDDMQLVIALACTNCGQRGTVIAAYGPMGDEVSQELLGRVAR